MRPGSPISALIAASLQDVPDRAVKHELEAGCANGAVEWKDLDGIVLSTDHIYPHLMPECDDV